MDTYAVGSATGAGVHVAVKTIRPVSVRFPRPCSTGCSLAGDRCLGLHVWTGFQMAIVYRVAMGRRSSEVFGGDDRRDVQRLCDAYVGQILNPLTDRNMKLFISDSSGGYEGLTMS